ncbi:exo-beta-N-acetylmuramidase NamZ domain-containing protein [Bradymonas sediminis]|uniref:DUF1343 domain-containing protein n=1 Tax=Bradymonas sediminis TaxID=1548548 RepID=A0A2Z4FNI6_9DELT|nr:DUF1343 domain-containing protein [Bradymonas sediminis]AWV90442.1 DUF1343 domain-containing protein [Bradymonas sediminis]TDP72172.1 uncharacterized protein YbbC (DUF1343 family) [Bradymonas sediminis]
MKIRVETGLDQLLADRARISRLAGARVGLLANPTTVDHTLEHAIDALAARGVELKRLFGPEHGVRAEAQDMESVSETRDPISGIPTVSLYGSTFESLQPSAEDLADLDIVIADIQDIGSRYYTYAYTIGLMMQACGEAGVEVWVLDRPNPITGVGMEGNIVRDEMRSFVGMQPLMTRHGMTLGELAHFFAKYCCWECEYEVIEMKGWRREMWFDETGLPWVMPSPNMPTLDTAIVYPGQCILEGTTLSEARGTTRPFELFGAPGLDAVRLRERMMAFNLPGVEYRLASFRPMFQKHANATCAGLQIHVTDRDVFESVAMSYAIISALLEQPGVMEWRTKAYEFVDDILAIDLLIGDVARREALEAGQNPVEVANAEDPMREEFLARRESCLLYK